MNVLIRAIGASLLLAIPFFQGALAQAGNPADFDRIVADIRGGQTDTGRLKNRLQRLPRGGIDLAGRWSLMTAAIDSRQADVIDTLVAWGLDPNLGLTSGRHGAEITPLVYAIMAKAGVPIVARLIDQGADVNRRSEGYPPLDFALNTRQYDVAMLLLDRGASASAVDGPGMMTFLMALSRVATTNDGEWAPALVKRLVAGGCDVNARSKRGGTALSFAAVGGNPVMLRALLEAGADPNLKNDEGETALAIVRRRHGQRDDLVQILRQSGAR